MKPWTPPEPPGEMDTPVLLTTNALLSSAAAIMMLVVLHTRKTYPGFAFWTAGVACLAVGAAMLVPGALPTTWVTRVLRNAVLLAGYVLILRGMLIFRGYRIGYWLEAVIAIPFLVVFGYYNVAPESLDARIVIYCVFAGALSLATVVVTLRHRPEDFGSNDILLVVWLSAISVLSFIRAAHQLSGPDATTAFEAMKGFGAYYAMAQILTVQLVTLTLISMNSQRIEWEYRTNVAQLRQAKDDREATLNALPDLLFKLDRDGRIEDFHTSTPEALYVPPTAFLGKRMAEVLPENVAQAVMSALDEAATKGRSRGTTYRLPIGGSDLWFELSVAAMAAPGDGTQRFVLLARDITARKQMELELQSHRDHLEELVADRTEQLQEATQRAEAASLAKSAFLANMSHEIRTPLSTMIGMAHLIRRAGLSPEQAGRLQKLEAAAGHLLEILNAILDLSKIDAGKLALEDIPLRVDSAVASVLSMLDDRANAKQLKLACELDPLPGNLLGDPTRLQQALLNYATNAIKFTERGSVTLRARLVEQDDQSALLRFEVQDTGIGIAPDVLPRLFSAFEQADRSTTRTAGGTGLGLAITRRLAELMGGEAGVESALGVGSRFWFTARLRKESRSFAEPELAGTEDAAGALRSRHAGSRILVAEDNEINAEVAKAILEDVGLTVDIAVDGIDVVDKVAASDYRLVLMDMQMPRMDGLDASREIRRRKSAASLPIIAMTANAFAEDKARCFEAGMDDFTSKPVDPDKLYALLLRWLDRTSGGAISV